MPKTIPRFVVDKVRFLCSDLRLLSPVFVFKTKSPIKTVISVYNTEENGDINSI